MPRFSHRASLNPQQSPSRRAPGLIPISAALLMIPAGFALAGPNGVVSKRTSQPDASNANRTAANAPSNRVISVRFDAETADWKTFQSQLGAIDENSPFAGLEFVRANRLRITDLRVPEGRSIKDVVRSFARSPHVDFAHVNTFGTWEGGDIPGDPEFDEQWGLHNTGQEGGVVDADVNALGAWEIQSGDPSIVIAVLDSGTDTDHPDLDGAFWLNPDEIAGNGIDDDANGYIDDTVGWNFHDDTNDLITSVSHGTNVAGVVGASRDNATGVVGMAGRLSTAPGSTGCRVMACCVGEFFPDSSLIDDAILYAMDEGVEIISMSLGVDDNASMTAAIEEAAAAGVIIVNAAGNGGPFPVGYPANHPDVLAIAGTTRFDERWSSSRVGPELIVAAPAQSIRTTALGGGYSTVSGTSFASPLTSAVLGLILSERPCLTAAEATLILQDSALDLGPAGFDEEYGWGRLDAAAALAAAAALPACPSACPADLDNDGAVGITDLIMILGAWGPCAGCSQDLDMNDDVGVSDLIALLASWGSCAG